MREIAIISGKGGTGKTTLALSLVPYLSGLVIADCDVDAPDLKILLSQKEVERNLFYGFQIPVFDYDKCINCKLCQQSCAFNAISESIELIPGKCEGCKLCEYICPADAIKMENHAIGHIMRHDTAYGTLIDAELFPGDESSGKLVSEVREKATILAQETNKKTILIDGSPGAACNVISTITGVDVILVVTEPTVSGIHDLKRVISLTQRFSAPVFVIINKATINPANTKKIRTYCQNNDIEVSLEVPFDSNIVNDISKKVIPSLGKSTFYSSKEWEKFINKIV